MLPFKIFHVNANSLLRKTYYNILISPQSINKMSSQVNIHEQVFSFLCVTYRICIFHNEDYIAGLLKYSNAIQVT